MKFGTAIPIVVLVCVYPIAGTEVDIANISFFHLKMAFNQAEVEDALSDLGKDFLIKIDEYGFTTIAPPNQLLPEGVNLDFQVGLYNDQIVGMSFYRRNDELLEWLLKTLHAEPIERSASDGTPILEWTFGDYTVSCWNHQLEGYVSYHISNNPLRASYWKDVETKMGDDPFF